MLLPRCVGSNWKQYTNHPMEGAAHCPTWAPLICRSVTFLPAIFCEMVAHFFAVLSKRSRVSKLTTANTFCLYHRLLLVFLFQLRYYDFLFSEVKRPSYSRAAYQYPCSQFIGYRQQSCSVVLSIQSHADYRNSRAEGEVYISKQFYLLLTFDILASSCFISNCDSWSDL